MDSRGDWRLMGKDRFDGPNEDDPGYLGTCECGCETVIREDDRFLLIDGELLKDEECVMRWLSRWMTVEIMNE